MTTAPIWRRRGVILGLVVALAAVFAVLSGCAADPGPSAPSTSRVWDPNHWVPPHPVVVAPLDKAEQQRRRRLWLNFQAETYHVTDPPPLPTVRRWLLYEETGPAWADCMRQAGWTTVVPNPDGNGATTQAPAGQDKAFFRAYYLCLAEYPIDARLLFQGPPQKDVLALNWDYFDSYLTPCLVAHGLDAPASFPSREVYIADPVAYPYPAVDPAVQRACPQGPPSALLIGSR